VSEDVYEEPDTCEDYRAPISNRFGIMRRIATSTLCALVVVLMASCDWANSPQQELAPAVVRGDNKQLLSLLQRKSEVDPNWMPGKESGPALVDAAGHGNLEGARLLLKFGANPNLGSSLSGTPLNSAAYHGDLEMCRLLISAGANVNLESGQYGWTPLMNATHNGHAAVAQLLIESGALR
jgi:ankyrin repeat protein